MPIHRDDINDSGGRHRRPGAGAVLDLAVLGALRGHPCHGYELRKRLSGLLCVPAISFGSLYPALARLEHSGLVSCEDGRGELPIPATGSLSGELAALRALGGAKVSGDGHGSPARRRNRRVYSLTPLGDRRLRDALADPAGIADDRGFVLRLALSHHLGEGGWERLLAEREHILEERLGAQRERAGDARPPGARVVRARLESLLAAELQWLRTLREEVADPLGSPRIARSQP